MKKQTYDLEERLLEYSVRIIKIVEQLPNTKANNHVSVVFHRRTTHAATAMQDRSGPGIANFGFIKENNFSALNTF
jgi:hypothetical protein